MLFTHTIRSWRDWGRVFQSIPAFNYQGNTYCKQHETQEHIHKPISSQIKAVKNETHPQNTLQISLVDYNSSQAVKLPNVD